MSKRILDESGTITVELVLDWLQDFCSRGCCALDYAINIWEVEIQAYRAGAHGGGAGISRTHAGILIGQHDANPSMGPRSEEHTSELQSHLNLVCRLLLEKKKQVDKANKSLSYC